MDSLFRAEVIQAQRGRWIGGVSLATPLAFFWWAFLAAALAFAIVLFLIFGYYTRPLHGGARSLASSGVRP